MNSLNEVKLRPFLQGDLNAVRDVIFSTIDTCYSGFYPPRAIEYFKQYHCDENILSRANDGCTIVAESKGRMIATGTLIENHICAVFVMRQAQGLGVGRRIMEYLEERARSTGVREITLDVSLPSRQFYERLGYLLSDDTYLDVGEGQRLDYWKASKSI
jgi:GNAT superfamily N-acetyltransferase